MSNNIDDELLALAGGSDSSDEDEVMRSDRGSRAGSAEAEDMEVDESAPSKQATAKRPKRRADGDSEDEEEGEAFSREGSPNSIGSAAMDESDSEAEETTAQSPPAEVDSDEKYPVDGMFVSFAEREYVMSLREVERESLLADRSAEIERQRQNRMLRQLVTKQENEEKKMKMKKRSADTANLDDTHKSGRQRAEVTKTGAAIDSLRRARAEKNDRARVREENRRQDDRSSRNNRRGSSSRSRSRSPDVFDDDRRSSPERPAAPRELPPPNVQDFERIRVGRSRFALFCFNPGFDNAITGCYARVSLGPDPKTGIDDYRMARIKGFTTGKPYAMNGPSGSFVTDQYVIVVHGKSERTFAFIFCSDKKFTEREFNRYMVAMKVDGMPAPKTQVLQDKIDDINAFVARNLTNEEISEKVERKRALRQNFDPERRERLRQDIEEAYAAGKPERAKKLEEQLESLLTNRLAFRTSLTPPRVFRSEAQQDRLADINAERRRQNAANVGKAQLKEKAETRKREAAIQRGEAVEVDRSRRIRTVARFVHENRPGRLAREAREAEEAFKKAMAAKSQSPNGSDTETPAEGPNTPKKETEMPHIVKARESVRKSHVKGMPNHRPITDDDIIAAIDLELDIDI